MGSFIINRTETGFVFLLKTDDGKTIGNSEVYTTMNSCRNGIESVKKNCNSKIEDQTVDGFEPQKSPKYEIYNDKGGQFRFRLKASNGQNILASMGYETLDECMGYIRCTGEFAPDAPTIMPGEEMPAPIETTGPKEGCAEPVPDIAAEAEPEPVADAEPKVEEPDEMIGEAEPEEEKNKKKHRWMFWKR